MAQSGTGGCIRRGPGTRQDLLQPETDERVAGNAPIMTLKHFTPRKSMTLVDYDRQIRERELRRKKLNIKSKKLSRAQVAEALGFTLKVTEPPPLAINPFDPPPDLPPPTKKRVHYKTSSVSHQWPQKKSLEKEFDTRYGKEPRRNMEYYGECGFEEEGMPVVHGIATMGCSRTGHNASHSISKIMGEFHSSVFS